MGTDHS